MQQVMEPQPATGEGPPGAREPRRFAWMTDDPCTAETMTAMKAYPAASRDSEELAQDEYRGCLQRAKAAKGSREVQEGSRVQSIVEQMGRPEWAQDNGCWRPAKKFREQYVSQTISAGRQVLLDQRQIDEMGRLEYMRCASSEEAQWSKSDSEQEKSGAELNTTFGALPVTMKAVVHSADPSVVTIYIADSVITEIDGCEGLEPCPRSRLRLTIGFEPVQAISQSPASVLVIARRIGTAAQPRGGKVDASAYAVGADCGLRHIASSGQFDSYVRARWDIRAKLQSAGSLPSMPAGPCVASVAKLKLLPDRSADAAAYAEEQAAAAAQKKREEERAAKLTALEKVCGGTILSQDEFVVGMNPHADKGKCVLVRLGQVLQAIDARSALVNVGMVALMRFQEPFRGPAVHGVCRVGSTQMRIVPGKGATPVVQLDVLDATIE